MHGINTLHSFGNDWLARKNIALIRKGQPCSSSAVEKGPHGRDGILHGIKFIRSGVVGLTIINKGVKEG